MPTRGAGARASSRDALPPPRHPVGTPPRTAALTLAGPGARRAGLGAGAPSPGAGAGARAGSPEQDLQRRTTLRGAEHRLRAARARPGAVGCGVWGGPSRSRRVPPRAPAPGRRTYPGRAPAGKWQRQWKAAAQWAQRSTSAPSPHTPHRAPAAGPCGRTRASTPAREPAGAAPRGGVRAREGRLGDPSPGGSGASRLWAAARGSEVPRPPPLRWAWAPSGLLKGSPEWDAPKEA